MTLTGMTTVATATIVERHVRQWPGGWRRMDGAWRGEAKSKRGGAGAAGCEDGEEGGRFWHQDQSVTMSEADDNEDGITIWSAHSPAAR